MRVFSIKRRQNQRLRRWWRRVMDRFRKSVGKSQTNKNNIFSSCVFQSFFILNVRLNLSSLCVVDAFKADFLVVGFVRVSFIKRRQNQRLRRSWRRVMDTHSKTRWWSQLQLHTDRKTKRLKQPRSFVTRQGIVVYERQSARCWCGWSLRPPEEGRRGRRRGPPRTCIREDWGSGARRHFPRPLSSSLRLRQVESLASSGVCTKLGVINASDADFDIIWKRRLWRFKQRKSQPWRRLPRWVMSGFRHTFRIKSPKNARKCDFVFVLFLCFYNYQSITRRNQSLRRSFWRPL